VLPFIVIDVKRRNASKPSWRAPEEP
jgi:uncharacterized membrane protein YsdA (DUF1294 family)